MDRGEFFMANASTISTTNKQNSVVPDIVISRLPIYLRTLTHMEAEGKQVTSSQDLGKRLGISSAQIRKDLSHFGEFGKQGTGYHITYLRKQLEAILNLDKVWSVALVGVGDLGHALAHYDGFARKGFHIRAIFDSDPSKIGQKLNNIVVQDSANLEEVVRSSGMRVAILAVPTAVAQAVTNTLIKAGVRAILNYAPITLTVPPEVKVQNIDPIAHLQQMTYYCKR